MTTGHAWRQLTLTLQTYAVEGRRKGFYKKRTPAPRNWSRYDHAQIHEMCDVLDLICVGVDTVSKDLSKDLRDLSVDPRDRSRRSRRPGRPRRPGGVCDLAKVVLLQQYMGMANRRLEGCLDIFSDRLGLVSLPGYKDVERAYGDPDVTVILLGLFDLTVQAVKDVSDFAVDGTGLSTSIKDNWYSYHIGHQVRYSIFEKIVCVVEEGYGLVSAFKLLESMHGGESPALRPLLEEVRKRHDRIGSVSGDSAFLSRENCTLVDEPGGVPRFYPKKNLTLRSRGHRAYQEMLLAFIKDPQKWLEDYHKRSICESTFSSLKRRCLTPLRREVRTRRKQEVLARIIIYNLIRLSYARWIKGLQTPLKQKHK